MIRSISKIFVTHLIISIFLLASLTPLIENRTVCAHDSIVPSLSSLGQTQNINSQTQIQRRPDGPAPKLPINYKTSYQQDRRLDRGNFYTYNTYNPRSEPFYAVNDDTDMFGSFVPSDPGTFTDIAPATPSGFIQNACFILDIYYVVDGYGGLYTVNTTTGVFTSVGPTGVTDTMGLAYDDTTGQMFMTAGTYTNGKLYSVDRDTGAATLIGTLGNTGFAMISIVCDNDGQLYGAEIVSAGSDGMFYSIDKATGAATPIGSVGFSMNYGQDMDYDKDNDILYLCAFNYDTFMAEFRTIDKTTGMSTFIANLAGQTTGFGIPYQLPQQFEHDISVQSIVKPGTGNVAPITPIVKVKNVGLNPEANVPVQLLIGKEVITGMVEDFEATDGGYTHAAKNPGTDVWQWGVPTSGPMAAHSGSNVWATNLAGPYPANMWCYLLSAPFMVPSGAMLNFWHWYYFESSWDGGNVKISSDGGMTWTLITPEGGYPGSMPNNPYMTGQPAFNGASSGWKQAFFDLSAYEGMVVQLMWECASDGSIQYDGWYIDDVGFTQSSWVNEYTQTATIASIASGEVVNLTFPVWTPSGLGSVENVNVNFRAEAINLFPDENVNNDYKAKDFTLHYGFLNDVKVNEIVSPVSGNAESQIPEVVIENVGQLDQTASVNMVINKITYGAEWKVWNPSGGNTWVRVTDGSARTGVGVAKCTYEYTALPNDDWLATPGNVVAPGGVFSFWVHGYTYNDDTYQVWISTTGNTIDDFLAGTMLFSGIAPSSYTLQSFDLSAYEGQTVYCGIFYNGNYAWYIWVDDVTLPDGTFEGFEGTIFPPKLITLTPEYDQTATVSIAAGETKSVTLPEWFPADLPVFMNIDYQADVEVTLGGISDNGNNMFIDNTRIDHLGEIPDEDPSNNFMSKMFTLSYEHDVGVIEITEPSGPSRNDIIWDNDLTYGEALLACQFDGTNDLGSCADDFQFTRDMDITDLTWVGGFWNGAPGQPDWTITIYSDASGPGDIVYGPVTIPYDDCNAQFLEQSGTTYYYSYTATLPYTAVCNADMIYWIGFQAVMAYPPQSGMAGHTAPQQLSEMMFKSAYFGYPDWVPGSSVFGTVYDLAFQLIGHLHQGGPDIWPPGTYPIAGIIQNFGVIYSEVNIPVNTKVTNDTGIVIYDQTVIVSGPLAPGEMTPVTFPDIIIQETAEAEGDYALTMKTMLNGDDHPNNDKEILTFVIYDFPPPPGTTATISGTMGMNGWYISSVTVTLTATDGIWPPGVEYTLYKVDDGAWTNYTEPFMVCDDGQHTVYFYSVYNDGSTEDIKSVSFKIDQTPPTIEMSVEKIDFHQWKFIANVTEKTSGISMVQCYIDDLLLGNMTPPGPYQWYWNGKGEHTVTGVAYDQAGNSAESIVTFTLNFHQSTNPFISHLFQLFLRFLETFPHMFPFLHSHLHI